MGKNLLAVVMQETQVDPWVGNIPWRREWQPILVLPGEFHGQGSLAGYSPWRSQSDVAEWLTCARNLPGCWLAIQQIQPTLRKLTVFEGGNRQAISVLISSGHDTTHLVPIVILWGVLFMLQMDKFRHSGVDCFSNSTWLIEDRTSRGCNSDWRWGRSFITPGVVWKTSGGTFEIWSEEKAALRMKSIPDRTNAVLARSLVCSRTSTPVWPW